MKVVCIIQARLGSTRLPAKVLKKLSGISVLEHDVDRLKRVKSINEIVIATTNLDEDKAIIKEAERLGVSYYCGSENNVLSRYYHAAKENNAEVVVRVTSDCPLIDSTITENTIEFFLNNLDKYDYVSNILVRTFPRGLDTEVFTYEVLEKVFKEANSDRDKEHVTPYIWSNPGIFKLGCFKNDVDYSDYRWTLDTEEDFKLISEVYRILFPLKNNDFTMQEILNLYNIYPELRDINKEIKQKEI